MLCGHDLGHDQHHQQHLWFQMNKPYRQFLIRSSMGFLHNDVDLRRLIEEDRLQPVLVRCGGGQFSCPAQDVEHFTEIITKENSDYNRDLSVYSLEQK